MARPDPGRVAGQVRRRERVAGRVDPPTTAPGDVHVNPVGPELDRRRRVVEPDRRVRDVVGGHDTTDAKSDGYDGPGTLFAAQINSVLAKYARSASSWKSPASGSLREERLRFATPIPCSTTHSIAAAKECPFARLFGPRTRTDTSSAPGAIAWTIPAQAVP